MQQLIMAFDDSTFGVRVHSSTPYLTQKLDAETRFLHRLVMEAANGLRPPICDTNNAV